jgi:hypothetical protein
MSGGPRKFDTLAERCVRRNAIHVPQLKRGYAKGDVYRFRQLLVGSIKELCQLGIERNLPAEHTENERSCEVFVSL